jgi:hypothetical protein
VVVIEAVFLCHMLMFPLMTRFLNEIGLAETTLVTLRVPTFAKVLTTLVVREFRFEIAITLRVPTFAVGTARFDPRARELRFETDTTLRVPTFARVAKTLVVVREFETTRLGRVPGTEELTLDRKPPSPLKNDEYTFDVKTAFEAFTSVNVPVPMGYPKEGAGVPEREKLI